MFTHRARRRAAVEIVASEIKGLAVFHLSATIQNPHKHELISLSSGIILCFFLDMNNFKELFCSKYITNH